MCKESNRIPSPHPGEAEDNRHAVVEFVTKYGGKLASPELWDSEDASRAVAAMDTLYREVVTVRGDKDIGLLVKEFHSGAITEMIAGICLAGREQVIGADRRTEITQQVVEDFGEAYTRLIEEQDPDGWLREFICANREFTGSIGGVPSLHGCRSHEPH